MSARKLTGLYVITDHALLGNTLLEKAEHAILGGARILQYRDKTLDQPRREIEACALAQLCRQHNVLFLINDDIELAGISQADGVHLGQKDTDLDTARQQLGKNKIIGITCHASLEAAIEAEQKGLFCLSQQDLQIDPSRLDVGT